MLYKLLLFATLSATAFAQQITLSGAGSTFAYPLYAKWADEYRQSHPNVQINYQSTGSGNGIRQAEFGTVDFGGTDGPMTDLQLANASLHRGTDILHFPIALGGVVPAYNIPGVSTELNFTPDALAGIYLGKITKWDDPEIQKANPDVHLPANGIVVIHRLDGSGTTYAWVDYLSKISPEWKSKVGVGISVNWPIGLSGKGNEGVIGLVKQTVNSIGYVELTYAIRNHIPYGRVRNSSGVFVKADLASITAAAEGAAQSIPSDFRVSISNAPGKAAYPISSFTWMLVPKDVPDKAKGAALKQFLEWSLTQGQDFCESLAYARLPKEVVAKEELAMKQLQY